ncbi:hypothetical protein XELAEV_18040415mg [Xenopus laevis]|nr:hypothetical protein XELAEV_18040415mg [Xenopus laevis]
METFNKTSETRFILLGLSDFPCLQVIYFLLFFYVYIFTLFGNILIITVVSIKAQLHTPMYFFLKNLSCIDIFLSTAIVPKLLENTLAKDRSISFMGCASQLYLSSSMMSTECVMLAVMAYDRYVAICHPLHYKTIMSQRLCFSLAAGSWTVSFLNCFFHVYLAFQLPFCRSNLMNHFFCELRPLFHLSCKDILFNEIAMYIAASTIAAPSFLLTIISYIHIISTILKINSMSGRHKTFSTCTSHISVVTLFYSNILFTYLHPHSGYSPEKNKIMSLLYTTLMPLINPIIYCMRNKNFIDSIKSGRKHIIQKA